MDQEEEEQKYRIIMNVERAVRHYCYSPGNNDDTLDQDSAIRNAFYQKMFPEGLPRPSSILSAGQ